MAAITKKAIAASMLKTTRILPNRFMMRVLGAASARHERARAPQGFSILRFCPTRQGLTSTFDRAGRIGGAKLNRLFPLLVSRLRVWARARVPILPAATQFAPFRRAFLPAEFTMTKDRRRPARSGGDPLRHWRPVDCRTSLT